jgi:histidinol-phosphate phosphatase family protein
MNQLSKIDQSWTLFLDRDGVINERNFDGYILQWSDFHFTPGLLDAAAQIGQHFGHVFVVTNQQCVAKQLITESELAQLHQKMKMELAAKGLQIDDIKVATERKHQEPFRRKPNTQMALELKATYPELDFKKAVMVGDTDSDIVFGKALGMFTVLVRSQEKTSEIPDLYIDHLADLQKLLL